MWAIVSLIISWFYVAPALVDLDYSNGKYYKKDINFGVVVKNDKNDKHVIYRSKLMGKSGLEKLYKHLDEQGLPRPKTIVYMNKQGYGGWGSWWDSRAIEQYKLQRAYGFKFYHPYDYSYRVYLDGENAYSPTKDIDKKKYLSKEAQRMFGFHKDDMIDGGPDSFVRIMEVVLDKSRQPVLFHCAGGKHRTGMVAMMIRYLQGGEWTKGAKTKVFIQGEIRKLNPAQYEYYLHNKNDVRLENFEFVVNFFNQESSRIKRWFKILN